MVAQTFLLLQTVEDTTRKGWTRHFVTPGRSFAQPVAESPWSMHQRSWRIPVDKFKGTRVPSLELIPDSQPARGDICLEATDGGESAGCDCSSALTISLRSELRERSAGTILLATLPNLAGTSGSLQPPSIPGTRFSIIRPTLGCRTGAT